LAAFCIDSFLLGLVAFIPGLFFFDQFVQLGPWGRAVGFVVAVLYFGLLNSAICGGQTIGKRFMRIHVVDLNGSLISLPRALARAAVFNLPYFLNEAAVPPSLLLSWLGGVFSFAVFGMGLSIIYLFIFNRRNRRSLHDLIVGTCVTKTNAAGGLKPEVWKGHLVVVTVFLVASVAAPFFLGQLAEKPFFKDILRLQSAVLRQSDVGAAAVQAGTNILWTGNGKEKTTFVTIRAQITKRATDYDALANQFAQVVFENYPDAAQKDRIVIELAYGYDLGLAWSNIRHGYDYTPAEWRERIESEATR
jgi:uncharacterized RDD family membrane protein YckC